MRSTSQQESITSSRQQSAAYRQSGHPVQKRHSSPVPAHIAASPFIAAQRSQIDDNFGPAIQAKAKNQTGLPDNLKSGVESLSGMSMDSVRVHYNSEQPAQLNAHAFAQGTDIHVAPGQEKHLPHEAWHVVQQAQGRVRPTLQMKSGVPINDDKSLEQEATMMGSKAHSAAPARESAHGPAKGELVDGIARSPYMAAQRQRMLSIFGEPGTGTAAAPMQFVEINTKNRKQVEDLRKRYVAATGSEAGWPKVLKAAKNLGALEAVVSGLENVDTGGSEEEDLAKVDKHGGKHLRSGPTDKRKMKAKSKTQPATFYNPSEYNDLIQQVVKALRGKDSTFCDVGRAIGVDKGEETDIVELYGSEDVGFHIRPKSSTFIKKGRKVVSLLGEDEEVSDKEEDKKEEVEKEKSGIGTKDKDEKKEERKAKKEVNEGKEEFATPSVSGVKSERPAKKGRRERVVVPARIEGVGNIHNVSGSGMNCLIRAIYASLNIPIDGQTVGLIRFHLVQQGVANGGNMLDLAGAAGLVLITYLQHQNVLGANRGIRVHTPENIFNVYPGPNPIHLWLSGNHFRGIRP